MDVIGPATSVALVLRGGLGNQLFQYAAARRVAQDLAGESEQDVLVLSYGSEWGEHHPDLQSLAGIPVRYPNRFLRSTLPGIAVRETWRDDISAVIARTQGVLSGTRVYRQSDPFEAYVLPPARRYVLDGFFQHRDWWLPTWRYVAEAIHGREPEMVQALRQEQRTVIKLRRSDYLGRGIVLTDAFYRQALERLEVRGQHVTVICEDPAAASDFETVLADFSCTLRSPEPITGNPNFDDFWHLAAASTQIMANSSYCWWAAAVAEAASAQAGTRVAYPEPWLPNTWSTGPMPDMGLEGWTSIPADFE